MRKLFLYDQNRTARIPQRALRDTARRDPLVHDRPRDQRCRPRRPTDQGRGMIRTLNVILVTTSIVALVGVYALKYSVEETAAEKVAIERNHRGMVGAKKRT